MPLRDYQTDLVNRVSRSWKSGHKAPCIVLPCGGGKSVIVAEMAKRTTDRGGNVLFLVHRKELCEQIEKTFAWWGVNMELCTVGMVQTITRRIGKIKSPKLIITDENHHCLASSYKKIYEAFPDSYKVGVTATPVRLDGSGLIDVNDDLIVGVSAKWLIEHNCLSPYRYYAPDISDLSGIKVKNGEFDAKQVETVLTEKKIFGDVLEYYKKLASGMKAICYCPTVGYSQFMAARFADAGISATHIDGKTPKEIRAGIIDKFRKGEIMILCNVDLISEGFDVPDCGCTIMLRPTKSLTLYIQQAMRCMRYVKGKQAVIIDHVGNYSRFGMPDDDREWTLKSRKKDDFSSSSKLINCMNCYATFYRTDSDRCPYCGEPIPKSEEKARKKYGEDKDVKLVEIKGFTVNTKTPDDCQSYKELLEFAKQRGYKPGWAWYQAKQRGLIR